MARPQAATTAAKRVTDSLTRGALARLARDERNDSAPAHPSLPTKDGMQMPITVMPPLLLALLLVTVIYYDLRYMLLPNLLAGAFVLLFAVAVAWTLPMDVLAWRIGVGLAVLMIGIAANAAGLLGGGDVKVLSALMLFVPYDTLLGFILALCLCTIAGIAGLLLLRRVLRGRAVTWRGLQNNGRYPFGISIGLAGLMMLFG